MSDNKLEFAISQLTEKFSFSNGPLEIYYGGVLRLLWIASKINPSFKQTAQTISEKYQPVFIALSSLHDGSITDSQLIENCFIILDNFIRKESIDGSVLKDDKLTDFSSTLDSIKQLIPEVIQKSKIWNFKQAINHLESIFFDNLPIPEFDNSKFEAVQIININNDKKIITFKDHEVKSFTEADLLKGCVEFSLYHSHWKDFHLAYQWIDNYYSNQHRDFRLVPYSYIAHVEFNTDDLRYDWLME